MSAKSKRRIFAGASILSLLLALRVGVLWPRAQHRLSWEGRVGQRHWQLLIARPDALYFTFGRYDPSATPTVTPPAGGYPAPDRKAFLAKAPEWKALPPARGWPRPGAASLSGRTPAVARFLAVPYPWVIGLFLVIPAAGCAQWMAHRSRRRTAAGVPPGSADHA
jgi:hypothetical protein